MKYKKLTKEQIIISLDRLTRFKNTQEKYLRVFKDIILSNLIEPKLKKSEIENLDFSIITTYATEIFNSSLEKSSNIHINKFIKDYENRIFINNEETQKLLNNEIDYISAINLIKNESALNIRWLKEICKSFINETELILDKKIWQKINQLRKDQLLKYPIEKVLLVEGITEEILLPIFGKYLGFDFNAHGIHIIPAGGKNQVVKLYYKLVKDLKIPIFVLLDQDAEENIREIKPRLRDVDKIHLVSCGEFEDLLPKRLIINTVNSHFKNFLTITENDIISKPSTVKTLEELFKTKGLHEFKKAEFAKCVSENINSNNDISHEIKIIIEEIKNIK